MLCNNMFVWATRTLLWGGGGGVARTPAEGGGGPEMGFRAGPFVLCKDGYRAGFTLSRFYTTF